MPTDRENKSGAPENTEKGSDKTKSKDKSASKDSKEKGKDDDKEQSGKKVERPKPKNAAELAAREEADYIIDSLSSHAGYLKPTLVSLASSLETSPRRIGIGLGLIYFCLHLISPAFILPHLSALVTLIVPIQATLVSVEAGLDEKKGPKGAKDSAQWSLFWAVYGLVEFARGFVVIWRPGWRPIFEIIRTGILITVGGPWFGMSGLVSHVFCIILTPETTWSKRGIEKDAKRRASQERWGEKEGQGER